MKNSTRPEHDLEEYIKAIKACPLGIIERDGFKSDPNGIEREKIYWDYGVYDDNWPILLKADFNTVLKMMTDTKYTIAKIWKDPGRNDYPLLGYKGDGVAIQFWNYLRPWCYEKIPDAPNSDEHTKIQTENFNISMSLHAHRLAMNEGYIKPEKSETFPFLKQIVEVIEDIANIALSNKIPLCFPESTSNRDDSLIPFKLGDNMLFVPDYSKTVYYFPDGRINLINPPSFQKP